MLLQLIDVPSSRRSLRLRCVLALAERRGAAGGSGEWGGALEREWGEEEEEEGKKEEEGGMCAVVWCLI